MKYISCYSFSCFHWFLTCWLSRLQSLPFGLLVRDIESNFSFIYEKYVSTQKSRDFFCLLICQVNMYMGEIGYRGTGIILLDPRGSEFNRMQYNTNSLLALNIIQCFSPQIYISKWCFTNNVTHITYLQEAKKEGKCSTESGIRTIIIRGTWDVQYFHKVWWIYILVQRSSRVCMIDIFW